MAINETRSMNNDLQIGLRDGAFKSITPDRGGAVDPSHAIERSSNLQLQYDITDQRMGIHPDGCNCEGCVPPYGYY